MWLAMIGSWVEAAKLRRCSSVQRPDLSSIALCSGLEAIYCSGGRGASAGRRRLNATRPPQIAGMTEWVGARARD